MTNTQLLEQLHIIYSLLEQNNPTEARRIFRTLNIVDTKEHITLPENTRYLIWNLYEYLIAGDENNATDIQEIREGFQKLFPEKSNIDI